MKLLSKPKKRILTRKTTHQPQDHPLIYRRVLFFLQSYILTRRPIKNFIFIKTNTHNFQQQFAANGNLTILKTEPSGTSCTEPVLQRKLFFNSNLNQTDNTPRLKPSTRGRLPLSPLLLSTSVMIDINYGRCLTCNDIFDHNLNNNNQFKFWVAICSIKQKAQNQYWYQY